MNPYLQGTHSEVFPPFELIGPPPPHTRSPAWRTHERRNTDPFAPPQSDFQDTDPIPEDRLTKPAKPRRGDSDSEGSGRSPHF
jgi:hypothetical protein